MPRRKSTIPWLDTRNGVYYAHWYNVDKRRVEKLSLRTEDGDEAKNRFAAFLTEGRAIYEGNRLSSELMTGAMLDQYLTEHVEKKVVDAKRAGIAVRHLKEHFKAVPAKSIDIPSCRAYADLRRMGAIGSRGNRGDRPILSASDSTIRRELGVLVAAIGHAVAWKRLTKADAPTIELTEAAEPKARWLTHGELTTLRAKAREWADNPGGVYTRIPAFIDLCYYTASRRGAIERLTWFQVKFDEGIIHLAKPGERKTKKRRPTVPIDPALLPTLKALDEAKTNEWVLGAGTELYHSFCDVAKAAGLEGVSPHVLRHSRATHLLHAGKNLWDVAQLLGDTVATVERVYGHACVEHMKRVLGEERKA